MKRAHLVIALCLVFVTYALVVNDEPEVTTPRTSVSVERPLESAALVDIAMPDLQPAARVSQAARVVVPVLDREPVAEDPCASVRAELEAAEAEYKQTIAQLTRRLAQVTYERDRCENGENTPYGAFLRSYEAEEITDPYVLSRIEDWLRQFPVFLRPGEATWIVERTVQGDWGSYGPTSEGALILFLGADRVEAVLSEERMAELREEYAEEAIFNTPATGR